MAGVIGLLKVEAAIRCSSPPPPTTIRCTSGAKKKMLFCPAPPSVYEIPLLSSTPAKKWVGARVRGAEGVPLLTLVSKRLGTAPPSQIRPSYKPPQVGKTPLPKAPI